MSQGKERKEKIILLGIVYVQVLICSSLFLLIFHSLSLCPSSRKASLTRGLSIDRLLFVLSHYLTSSVLVLASDLSVRKCNNVLQDGIKLSGNNTQG